MQLNTLELVHSIYTTLNSDDDDDDYGDGKQTIWQVNLTCKERDIDTHTQGHTPCLKSFIRILDDIHSRQLMQTGNDKHDGKRRQQQQQQLITTGERTSNHATPQLDLIRSV